MDEYKAVHVGYYHANDDTRIVKKECKTLSESSRYNLTYITSNRNSSVGTQEKDGIRIIVLPLVDKRFVRLFRYINDLYKEIVQISPDVCHIHEFVLYPLIKKLKKKNIKIILDFHENDIEVWRDKFRDKYGNTVSKIFFHFISKYEKTCVKRADATIVVDRKLENRIGKYGKPPVLIPNYPIVSTAIESLESIRQNKNICFAGGYSDTWSIKKIMMSLELLDEVNFLLAGFGDDKYIDSLKSYSSWERTKYYGKIPFDSVQNEIYKNSTAGVALLKYDESWSDGPLGNTKIFEYMLAGLPVICTDFPIWKEIIESNNCGICVNPNDIRAIVDAISFVMSDSKSAMEMGENGRKLVMKKYNWEKLAVKLEQLYKDILGEKI